MNRSDDDAETRRRRLSLSRSTVLWVMLAVICTGLLVGWLIGLSESPVAAVVLPLLFALVAGAGGFHFATSKLGSDLAKRSVHYAAQATVCFMLACGVGLHFAIVTKTSGPASPAVAPAAGVPQAEVSRLSAVEIIRLSALQKKLLLLGLDADTVRVFGEKYIDDYVRDSQRASAEGTPAAADLDRLQLSLEAVAAALENADDDRLPLAFNRLRYDLPKFIGHIANLRKLAAGSGTHVPRDHYRRFLEMIDEDLSSVLEHKEGHEDGTVATPAPRLDYVPLYALALEIAVQKEPLASGWDYRSALLDRDDMELLDTAIRLGLGDGGIEKSEPPGRRYAIAP